MQPEDAPAPHPVLAQRLSAAVEVWRGLYGDTCRSPAGAPTDAEIQAAHAALGVCLPTSYVYFCRRAASSLPSDGQLGHLKLITSGPASIVEHNQRLRADGHPPELIAFWEGDDGDYCFDTAAVSGTQEPPVIYVDHWSNESRSPAGRHFLDWLTRHLRHEIDQRRAALDRWDGQLPST